MKKYYERCEGSRIPYCKGDLSNFFNIFKTSYLYKQELKEFATKDNKQFLSVIHASDKVQGYMKMKVEKLETEKVWRNERFSSSFIWK